ncbi:MAG: BREX-1 system adenine-specific DNA-methyltransferase PglX [Gammaproteobacteria bacterium]|nr:BREX-1 system adenine-specific DNA-methyltransferase PglX [Gammaproteobacteria bacterium]
MDTSKLKKFAQYARRSLIEQVGSKLNQVLSDESPAGREHPEAVAKLKLQIAASDKTQVIEQVAYTWFNRFCALRFMDVNEYSRIMVVSPLAGQFQPEILAEAKAGHIDDAIVHEKTRVKIFNLLNGTEASRDPQSEAYRLLIVAVCNDYHRIMPYLFERIEDYTELLMPDDLLSGNSILAYTREAMTPDACESVESIGWLYQFYISEKKDDVFAELKKNKKVTPENIPAATQLFTPHWIVRYLVENSLGRLWMLNNPDSKVIEQMDYYIKPVEIESDFLKISSPEELKICDPACGSGHMLTYAYDLLYAIYLDDGRVDPADIPGNILTNNLYGIEIDGRASELAAFALTMKAVKGNPLDEGDNRRRFFRGPVKPNICRLEKVAFTDEELDSYIDFVGKDLFTQDLRATLKEFEEADNFGSLIQPTLKSPQEAIASLEAKDVSGQLFLTETHKSVLKVLTQAEYLSQKYQVVVANPPYMGGKGMNGRLANWTKNNYPSSKSDLFAIFIERCLNLAEYNCLVAMITMQSWMFLSSFEELRKKILDSKSLISLVQIGYNSFPEMNSKVVQASAFVINNSQKISLGDFVNLNDAPQSADKEVVFRNKLLRNDIHHAGREDFHKIPGSPIAYWFKQEGFDIFLNSDLLSDVSEVKTGMTTSDNDRFLRSWSEVSYKKIKLDCTDSEEASESGAKWFPYNKGGGYRKWYGFNESVVNWENGGLEIKSNKGKNGKPRASVRAEAYYFQPSITYSAITSSKFSARLSDKGFIFDSGGSSIFSNTLLQIQGVLSSNLPEYYLAAFNSTLNFQPGDVARIPLKNLPKTQYEQFISNVKICRNIARKDWDDYEVSWGFSSNPLMSINEKLLKSVITTLFKKHDSIVYEIKRIEEENNLALIRNYYLEGQVKSSVNKEDITLFCNPFYQKKSGDIEEKRLSNVIFDFISYSVGCMFGRYSLDKDGLILSNHGETLAVYFTQIPNSSFEPDDDNVIPLIDLELERGKQEDWFEDDISERFKTFLKVTFGTENYDENLRFIEDAIGKDIKKFFLKDFYADHLKRYKKRPIYWLFSSPKGSFNALIYMHRYRSDTVSVVLNDYLREFRTKLEAKKESYEQTSISANAEPADKTKALKAIEKIKKVLEEVKDYERDILYPLAGQNIEIDLDDGVKHNYPLFGSALKKVPGLS